MKRKMWLAGAALMLMLTMPVLPAKAEYYDPEIVYSMTEDSDIEGVMHECMSRCQGGKNYFRGEYYNSTEKAQELDELLSEDSYYTLLNEDEYEEKRKALLQCTYFEGTSMSQYINEDGSVADNIKLYVMMPCVDMYIKSASNEGVPEWDSWFAVASTTVIIDYNFSANVDAKDTYSDEFGDNLDDEKYLCGYIKFVSPCETSIVLRDTASCRYYNVPIKPGDNVIKFKQNHYRIMQIGGVDIDSKSDVTVYWTNPYTGEVKECNNFTLTGEYSSPDTPYELSLRGFLIKHGLYIPPSGETEPVVQNVGEVKNVVAEPQEKKKGGISIKVFLIIGIIAALITFGVNFTISRAKDEEEMDDDDDYI